MVQGGFACISQNFGRNSISKVRPIIKDCPLSVYIFPHIILEYEKIEYLQVIQYT